MKRALLPLTLGAALLVPLAPAASATDTVAPHRTVATAASTTQAAISRDAVINRAKTWLTAVNGHQVPYSQTNTFQGYRTDCSGYVSMALQLPKPGPNTVGLVDSHTSSIAMSQLQKGDLIIDANGTSTSRHVVIFEKWSGPAHNSYWAYEQRGGHGTDHRQLSYGIGADQYNAYRPNKY